MAALVNIGMYILAFRVLTPKGVPSRHPLPRAAVAGVSWTALQADRQASAFAAGADRRRAIGCCYSQAQPAAHQRPRHNPLRAPFASYEGMSGPAELADEPRGRGEEKTIGQLATCPFCAEVWIGTGLTAGLVFLPSMTRLVMGTLAALAGADILQFVHAWLSNKAE